MRWATPLERFQERIEQDRETACWVWVGATRPNGYGSFRADGHVSSHRWAYAHFVGPIPEGYEVDHTCERRGCANPDHLEAVTLQENRRRRNESRTECSNGHAYTPENTEYTVEKGTGYRSRRCIACRRKNDLAHYARNSARLAAEARARRAARRA